MVFAGRFVRNRSKQFEARLVIVEVPESPSVLLRGMDGSRMPTAVAHGEGRAELADAEAVDAAADLVALRSIENGGTVASHYPPTPAGRPKRSRPWPIPTAG